MSSADEWIQQQANPGGRGLPVTAETLAELLVRVSAYALAVRDDEEDVMGLRLGARLDAGRHAGRSRWP